MSISNLKYAENFDLIQERANGFKSFFRGSETSDRIIHTLDVVKPKYENLAILLNHPMINGILSTIQKFTGLPATLNENSISTIRLVVTKENLEGFI